MSGHGQSDITWWFSWILRISWSMKWSFCKWFDFHSCCIPGHAKSNSQYWISNMPKLKWGMDVDFLHIIYYTNKIKFSIKDFFSKCDQILSFLRIWSHLLKKHLMENFSFFVQSTLEYRIIGGNYRRVGIFSVNY